MKKIISLVVLLIAFVNLVKAQIIGATNTSYSPAESNSSEYRQTGPSIRFSTGYPNLGLIAFNYQISSVVLLGAGAGIEIYDSFYSTIYSEVDITPFKNKHIFFNAKVGIYPESENLFYATMVGWWYKNINIGLGYSTDIDYHKNQYGGWHDYVFVPMLSISYNLPLSHK